MRYWYQCQEHGVKNLLVYFVFSQGCTTEIKFLIFHRVLARVVEDVDALKTIIYIY